MDELRNEFQYPRRIEPLVQLWIDDYTAQSTLQFQYPRRIEPLVQPPEPHSELQIIPRFSILVGSSLWCNRCPPGLVDRVPGVSVSSSDRASGATR